MCALLNYRRIEEQMSNICLHNLPKWSWIRLFLSIIIAYKHYKTIYSLILFIAIFSSNDIFLRKYISCCISCPTLFKVHVAGFDGTRIQRHSMFFLPLYAIYYFNSLRPRYYHHLNAPHFFVAPKLSFASLLAGYWRGDASLCWAACIDMGF